MISVGDRIGSVEKIFPRLKMYLENRKTITDKLTSALAYPVMVLFVTVFGGAALIAFVLPRLEAIFSGFGGTAAETIKANINSLQIGMIYTIAIFLFLIITFIVLSKIAGNNREIAYQLHKTLLHTPVIGGFLSTWQTLNFAFAMETLVSGGVSVELAISESLAVISNEAYARALVDVKNEIIKGISLSEAFNKHTEFPEYMMRWLIIGEKTGKTERIFAQIRTYFQKEVEQLSSKYMTLIEPVLITVVGLFLLMLILKIIVPFFSMYGTLV
jgi:type II secretory pathway component PulF